VNREDTWQKLIDLAAVTGNNPAGPWHLSFAHLSGADLGGVDLSEADLIGADFRGADLSGADLSGAHLSGSDLSGANLTKAYLFGAKIIGADLTGADLTGADLTGVNLSKAYLFRANLAQAYLAQGDLNGSDLRGTDLRGADLTGANLSGVNLSGADLTGVNLSKAYLFRANLSGVSLSGADLRGADLSRAKLIGARLIEAELIGANLSGADLRGADLTGADLNNASFLDANLHKSMVKEANVMRANFNSADLSGADITGAIFWGVSTAGWKIDGIKAEYIFFTRNLKDKEKHKKSFKKGQFEAMFKTLPTIELIFDGVLSLRELYILNAIIEYVKEQNPQFHLNLKSTSVDPFQTSVGVTASQGEYLEKAATMIREAIKNVTFESLLPQITKILPFQGVNESALKPYAQQLVTINQNLTINLIHGEGSIFSSGSNAGIEYNNIIHRYQSSEKEVDALFEKLKTSLHWLGDSSRQTMQNSIELLIAELKKGKEIEKAQAMWNQIKEDDKTAGSASSIISALTKLLGM
jgi:uncharacterized protein YjbI with pentapeptide repeats